MLQDAVVSSNRDSINFIRKNGGPVAGLSFCTISFVFSVQCTCTLREFRFFGGFDICSSNIIWKGRPPDGVDVTSPIDCALNANCRWVFFCHLKSAFPLRHYRVQLAPANCFSNDVAEDRTNEWMHARVRTHRHARDKLESTTSELWDVFLFSTAK